MTEQWQVVSKNDDYVLATWQQVFAVVWRNKTTLTAAAHLRRACAEFATSHPEGIGLLTIVESGAPLPSSEARDAIAKFLDGGGSYIRCSAVIFEGSGFRASAIRSVVTGLNMLTRQAFPHQVCSIDDAAALIAGVLTAQTKQRVDPLALKASLAEFRAELDR